MGIRPGLLLAACAGVILFLTGVVFAGMFIESSRLPIAPLSVAIGGMALVAFAIEMHSRQTERALRAFDDDPQNDGAGASSGMAYDERHLMLGDDGGDTLHVPAEITAGEITAGLITADLITADLIAADLQPTDGSSDGSTGEAGFDDIVDVDLDDHLDRVADEAPEAQVSDADRHERSSLDSARARRLDGGDDHVVAFVAG